ncbi:hypothetical protein [Pseudoxanthomonas suwonensis]|uniref:hypothetical protein n=1 Tax=Pseudoxanthomonas suwonensis TaxID=314722 RepID=UPI0006962AC9|nr:hypothetical protein [Pseudoxanthomonas suwonensis]
MKLRLFTGLALALALGGCTTYGYVGDGGGYYTGSSSRTAYSTYGYSNYGYGVYGYGSPYHSYRYNPGWSFGLRYGYPYSYYAYPGGIYRPPYYHQRPPHHYPYPGPRPGHDGRPDHDGRPGHDGRPDRPPPVADGNPPPLNRGPWRDMERLRRGNGEDGGPPRRRQPGPGAMGIGDTAVGPVPAAEPGTWSGGARPAPAAGYRGPGVRAMGGDDAGGTRSSGMAPRAERTQRSSSAPRVSESRRSGPDQSATRDTFEP